MKYLLPENRSYRGRGTAAGPPDVQVADWVSGLVPEEHPADLLAVIGSFEFAADPKPFLEAVRRSEKEVLLTYHATDDTKGIDRPAFGWRSHFSRKDLLSAFDKVGFKVTALWAFDVYQSLFRLRPLDTGRGDGRVPEADLNAS